MKMLKRFIALLVLLLIIGGIAAYSILSSRVKYNPEGATGNTAGNLMNGGLFAEHGGIIYFANPYDNNTLYSMNSDCTDLKKLSEDTVSCINVCDNYIFYVRNNFDPDNSGMVFRGQLYGVIRTDLKGKHAKALTTDVTSAMLLNGNTLIYSSYKDNKITTRFLSIDKKTNTLANDAELPVYSLYDNSLYYSGKGSSHSVYAFHCGLKTSSCVLDGNTYMASMVDGILYYIDLDNNYALTKYDPAANTSAVLAAGRCVNYNVYQDVIFYQTEGSQNALRRVNTDGTGDILIMAGNADSISCTSQYTFFTFFNNSILYRCPTHGTGAVQTMTLE